MIEKQRLVRAVRNLQSTATAETGPTEGAIVDAVLDAMIDITRESYTAESDRFELWLRDLRDGMR